MSKANTISLIVKEKKYDIQTDCLTLWCRAH